MKLEEKKEQWLFEEFSDAALNIRPPAYDSIRISDFSDVVECATEFRKMLKANTPIGRVASALSFLDKIDVYQIPLIASLCFEEGGRLLNKETARKWPEEHANTLCSFIRNMPCQPLEAGYPCGRRELFVAATLMDSSVSLCLRSRLWRMLVRDGYKMPRYLPGKTWAVPKALYDHPAVRAWITWTKQDGWADIQCTNRFFFEPSILDKLATEKMAEAFTAIRQDSPADLLMPLDLQGRQVPKLYMQGALATAIISIVTYLFCHSRKFNKLYSPRQLLLYACTNWNHRDYVSFIDMLEERQPGLVRSTLDAFGHDALWYTLYQPDDVSSSEFAAKSACPNVVNRLVELGCDPKRKNSIGLCYEDLAE